MALFSHGIIILSISISLAFQTVASSAAQNRYNWRSSFLNPHNVARGALGLKPLKWDNRVASYAQWYANQRRSDCRLIHSNGPYGENLFWGSGSGGWKPEEAVAAWLAERPQYNYYTNACEGGMCGHYTQIVWRSSRRLGCAMVVCDGNKGTLAVCSYDPPGNYVGMRPY